MIAAPLSRLLWKEYRQQRMLWLAVLAAGMVVQLVLRVLLPADSELVKVLWAAPLVIALFYLPGSAAMLFALEREERTSDWLLSLAPPSWWTLLAKYGYVAVSTLALVLSAWLWAVLLTLWLPHPSFDELFPTANLSEASVVWRLMAFGVTWGLTALGILAWGALGSLTSRRVVVAVPVGLVWWMFMMLVPLSVIATVFGNQLGRWRSELESAVIWFGFVAVLAADVWLGWRWCLGRYLDAQWLDDWNERLHARLWWRGERVSRIPAVAESEYSGWRIWRRLTWQERRRESFHSGLLWIGCGVGVFLALYSGVRGDSITVGMLPLVVPLPLAMGLLGFRFDAAGQQLRFLAQRGTSPALIWLAKHAVWLPRAFWIPAVVFTVAMLAELVFIPWSHAELALVRNGELVATVPWSDVRHPLRAIWLDLWRRPGLVLWFVLLTYGVGQLTAMLIRKTVIAISLGLVASGLVTAWLWSMNWLEVPLWWSSGSLVVWLWLLTWRAAPSWLLERRSRSEWGRLAAGLVLPPLLLGGAVAIYRAVEVPGFGPSSPTLFAWLYPREFQRREPLFKLRETGAEDGLQAELQKQTRAETPDESAVAKRIMATFFTSQSTRYHELMQRQTPEMMATQPGVGAAQDTIVPGDVNAPADALLATPEQKAKEVFLRETKVGLKELVELAQRDRCGRFQQLMTPGISQQWGLPQQVVLLEAARLRAEDARLDEALTYLCASLRLATFWAEGGGISSGWNDGLHQQALTLQAVVDWANHPAQTSRSLLAGLGRVNAELGRFPTVIEAVVAQYVQDSGRLDSMIGWRSRVAFSLMSPQDAMRAEAAVRLPWEVARLRRAMEQQLVWRFQTYGRLRDWLSRPGIDAPRRFAELTAHDPELAEDERARRNSLLGFMTRDTLDPEILRLAVQREATVREVRLALVLLAWKLDHGTWPETLGDILQYRTSRSESDGAAPPAAHISHLDLPAITLIDPWDGDLFEYSGTVLNKHPGLRGDYMFLTSVGPDQRRTVVIDNERDGGWSVKTMPDRGGTDPTIFTPVSLIAREGRLSLRVP